jgi:hypothetical protein
MKVDGACACGAIKVEAEADPDKAQICHCTDCQTATGTAFRVSIPVPGASLKITGKPAIYMKTTAESGRPRGCRLFAAPAARRFTPPRRVKACSRPIRCASAFCVSATNCGRGASSGGARRSHG